MRKRTKKTPIKQNKNLPEVAKLTGKSYGYVKQVAAGIRSNTLIERAIIAYEEQDFAALNQIKDEVTDQSNTSL